MSSMSIVEYVLIAGCCGAVAIAVVAAVVAAVVLLTRKEK